MEKSCRSGSCRFLRPELCIRYTTNGRGCAHHFTANGGQRSRGRVIFAPFTNQFGSPYTSFDFVANDGDVDSAAATVTINIVGKPYTATLPAQPVTLSDATFNGMVTANGFPTVAWFEWGTDFSYGSQTAPVNAGSGVGVFYFSVSISNLIAGQRYHCRLVASNAAGAVRGVDQSFITGGRLTLWGNNAYGQTMAPQGLTNVVAVSGGQYHSLFLQANGVVLASGPSNMTNVPSSLSNVVAVSAGEGHSLALKSDGTVVAWGQNYNGETNVPSGLSNVVAIAAGPSAVTHSSATGRLWAGVFTTTARQTSRPV